MKKLSPLLLILLALWGATQLLAPVFSLFGPTNNAVLVAQAEAEVAEAQALSEVAAWGQEGAKSTQILAASLGRAVLFMGMTLLVLAAALGWVVYLATQTARRPAARSEAPPRQTTRSAAPPWLTRMARPALPTPQERPAEIILEPYALLEEEA